ncbi:hypothetical protein GGR54DRAFT_110584 [Hypoxylon sp. NC1633]|nr:hypothetical protein GGR54DRAFT_110584 [Hypoxylon sp. NC1633]
MPPNPQTATARRIQDLWDSTYGPRSTHQNASRPAAPTTKVRSDPWLSVSALQLGLQPRSFEELHTERLYLLGSLQQHDQRAVELFWLVPVVEEQIQSAVTQEQRGRAKKQRGWLRHRIVDTVESEKAILARLSELHVEIQCRERWCGVDREREARGLDLLQAPPPRGLAPHPHPHPPLSTAAADTATDAVAVAAGYAADPPPYLYPPLLPTSSYQQVNPSHLVAYPFHTPYGYNESPDNAQWELAPLQQWGYHGSGDTEGNTETLQDASEEIVHLGPFELDGAPAETPSDGTSQSREDGLNPEAHFELRLGRGMSLPSLGSSWDGDEDGEGNGNGEGAGEGVRGGEEQRRHTV